MFNRIYKRGFTLLEVSIVCAVIGIISALAGWQVQVLLPKYRTRAAAVEFAKYVDLCRNLAIRGNKECKVTILLSDSTPTSLSSANVGKYSISMGNSNRDSTAWDILPEDTFVTGDSTDSDSTLGIIDISTSGQQRQSKVSIVHTTGSIGGPGNGLSDSIVFSPRGYVTNPSSDFNATGYIEIVFANKLAMSENISENFVVMITKTGMTRLDNTRGRRWESYFSGTGEYSSY
jgi:prepilin-type N-terminal cleavage/methylation domain-containing protein